MNVLKELDPEQTLAATSPMAATIISAGAGTGKTTTLTARIAWLLEEKRIPANSIMAVTFTNRAARELKERVIKKVGPLAEGLRLGTFHGLSSRIVRRHAETVGLKGRDYAIADEEEARGLMHAAAQVQGAYGPFVAPAVLEEDRGLKVLKKEYDDGLLDFSKRALKQVSLWKGWGLTDLEASDPNRPNRSEEEERFASAYSAYQYELESRNLADFGDLILKSVTLFKTHPEILSSESEAIRHLLVDEAQDANPVQVEWARLLSSFHGAITVVGDEDQNIYGFQGGYPGAMRDMAGNNATEFHLLKNRRCTDEILRPANNAVDYNRRSSPKILVSGRSGSPVRATGHATDFNEAAWISARIAELVEAGTPPDQIAVLFRATHIIPAYEEALARKGIATAVTSGKSLLAKEEARDVIAMIRMAVNPYDDLSFQRLASRPNRGLGTSAVETLTAISASRGVPFFDACSLAANPKFGTSMRKDAKDGAQILSRALHLLAEEGKWNRHTHDIISVGLEETGYLKWLEAQEGATARLDNVEAVHRLSEGYPDATEFLQDMSLLTDGESGKDGMTGKVRLSTIHSVKGLEFDHVFCPAFDDGVMPNSRAVDEGRRGKPGDRWAGPQGGGVEEERRLAHVAFTRARHGLDVSFAWKRGSKRVKGKGGGPSSFIEECDLAWTDIATATTAELGRVKSKSRKNRSGYDR